MKIEQLELSKLTPYARNAKKHPKEQIAKIALQISKVGFLVPIVTDKNLVIITGHGRYAAAQQLALREVPVLIADHLSEEEANAFRIADNKVAESEWDLPLLSFELGSLERANFDLTLTAIEPEAIEKLLKELNASTSEVSPGEPAEKKDDVPPPPRIARSKLGELWHLGRHNLFCGDATNLEDVKFLLGTAKPTMLFTDPPYGIKAVQPNGNIGWSNKAEVKNYMPVKNDESTDTAENFYEVLKKLDIKKQIIWGGNYFTRFLPPTACWFIWDKGVAEGTTFAEGEVAWTNFNTPLKFIRHQWSGFIKDSERGEGRVHPTQKPSFLAEWVLSNYGTSDDLILDPFAGSGSTLIAAEKSGHSAFVMELEPVYCDVILERFFRLTGTDPVRADGMSWEALKSGEAE